MANPKALSFQDVVMKLDQFWAEQGCLLWQPYNIQVGAGTNNPATLLRVLGPEPWWVAYIEPSIRPDDGRYAENPNRMQAFYQYQVILKPDPGNPQEIYLKSLEAIGIDPRQHDIRFVEDNWESPALGAWGLGWEVWLDGQEITQFTYFQQAGGMTLDPVAVEITYGVERIVLALQDVAAVWDMRFAAGVTYGDLYRESEIEHCRYYFEIGDVQGLKQTYEVYSNEHKRALEAGALIPAYDYVLKCSHLFNVLDTRGAIGVTERAYYFRRMRDMTRNVAKAFVEQREQLGYPLLHRTTPWAIKQDEKFTITSMSQPAKPADVLLEIGVEEMPYGDVATGIEQLKTLVPALLDNLFLEHAGVEIYGTPRRLAVLVRKMATHQTTRTVEVKGPPVSRAFDDKGNPTKAAEGFAKGQGVMLSDLRRKMIDGGEYIVANVTHDGQAAMDVLAKALPELIANIKFDKSMRWNNSGIAFSRPIRWLVGLYGDQVIAFTYAGAHSGKTSRGLRPLGSPEIALQDAASYLDTLKANGVTLDSEQRQAIILQQVTELAAEVGGKVAEAPGLLAEVVNLVEQPTVLRGEFDQKFLDLPREVLVTVMRKHQRYFAVEDEHGQLLPYFLAVRNGDDLHLDKVTHGNEHVLVARFSDAVFFFNSDREQPLESYLPRLSTLTFQEKLGSMLDKNNRVAAMVESFGELLGAAEDVMPIVRRAAQLIKADLATQMVVEMTSLQGVMGRIYATLGGESPEVANAIFQHWLPRSADDILPSGAPGIMLALLDRLDSLVGLFAVGLAPTASADPFALRRAALGVIQILLDQQLELDLRDAIHLVARYQPVEVSEEAKAAVLEFIIGRLRVWLVEQGQPRDVIEAVLAEQGHDPVRVITAVQELRQWTEHEDWAAILDSYARCVRISRDKPIYSLHPENFTLEAEKALFEAYFTHNRRLHPIEHNVGRFLATFVNMVPAITDFFKEVMVMDENLAVRENRLALLQHIAAMAHGRADLSKLQGF